jgi:hypothetical protein
MEAVFLLALESFQYQDALFWNAHRLYKMYDPIVPPGFTHFQALWSSDTKL